MLAFTSELAVHILIVGVVRVIIGHGVDGISCAVSEYLLNIDELSGLAYCDRKGYKGQQEQGNPFHYYLNKSFNKENNHLSIQSFSILYFWPLTAITNSEL